MSDHPIDDEALLAFAGDEFDPAAAAVVAVHVAACPACAATIARYRLVRATLRADDSSVPPLPAVARAKGIFGRHRRAAPLDLVSPLRRIVARLTFDSQGGFAPAIAGFRGGNARHLAFESDEAEVDLQVEPPAESGAPWQILGQITADPGAPATRVALAPAGENRAVVEVELDEHGFFILTATPGRYDVSIRLPDSMLVLPDLEVG